MEDRDTLNPDSDFMINQNLEQVISKNKCKITIDRISYKDARNAYYARTRVQNLYDKETYYL
jgi:hypothetical protein